MFSDKLKVISRKFTIFKLDIISILNPSNLKALKISFEFLMILGH